MIDLSKDRWCMFFIVISIAILAILVYSQPLMPVAVPSKLVATWEYNTNAGGYWIQWTTNGPSFSTYKSVSVERTNRAELTTIEQGKVYHVRVSTTGPRSPWSAIAVFAATNAILPTVVTIYIQSGTNLLNWQTDGFISMTNPTGAQKFYRLQITEK